MKTIIKICIIVLIPLLLVACHSSREIEDAYTAGYADAMEDSIPRPDPSQPDLGYDIAWEDVDSSMFKAVGYDSARSVLGVLFLDSGKRYYYVGFSPDEYDAFISADSLGSYYNEYIKAHYYSFREDGSPTGASPK